MIIMANMEKTKTNKTTIVLMHYVNCNVNISPVMQFFSDTNVTKWHKSAQTLRDGGDPICKQLN